MFLVLEMKTKAHIWLLSCKINHIGLLAIFQTCYVALCMCVCVFKHAHK